MNMLEGAPSTWSTNTTSDGQLQPSKRQRTAEGGETFVIPIKRKTNARERSRTATVNDAFMVLRDLIPTQPINRKLSKIETLRLATSYIAHLNSVLTTGRSGPEQPCIRHSDKLHSSIPMDAPYGGCQQPQQQSVCTFCMNEYKQYQQEIETNIPHLWKWFSREITNLAVQNLWYADSVHCFYILHIKRNI